MKNSDKGRVVLMDGKAYERHTDGTLVPLANRTDYARLDAMSDEAVENEAFTDRDGLPMSDEEWLQGAIDVPVKVPVGLKLDQDVLDWFRSNGRGYQTRMNSVLRKYMEAHRKTG